MVFVRVNTFSSRKRKRFAETDIHYPTAEAEEEEAAVVLALPGRKDFFPTTSSFSTFATKPVPGLFSQTPMNVPGSPWMPTPEA